MTFDEILPALDAIQARLDRHPAEGIYMADVVHMLAIIVQVVCALAGELLRITEGLKAQPSGAKGKK